MESTELEQQAVEQLATLIKPFVDAINAIVDAVVKAIKAVVDWFVEILPRVNRKALHLAVHARKWRARKKNAKRIFDTRRK